MRCTCLRRFAAAQSLLALLLVAGCTKTKVFTTAPFEPGADAAVTRRAPRDAVYKVKWFDPGKGELHTLHGTERAVLAGQRIGFAPRAEGGVLAFAGDEEFPIERISPRAAYCIWVAKVKKETMFARRMRQVAAAGGKVVVGAAIIAADAYVSDGDCEE